MVIDLQLNRTTEIEAAKSLLARIKSAQRDPSDAENAVLQGHMSAVELLDRQIKGRALVQSVTSLGTCDDGDDSAVRHGIFTDADAASLVTAVKSRTTFRVEVPSKAVIGVTGVLPTAGLGIVPGNSPGSMFALASLFANEAASGPSIRYYVMSTGVAEVVAEGAIKPDAGLAVTPKDALLVKLATTSQITDELSSDAPQIVSSISSALQAAIVVAENDHVVTQLGGASGILVDTATGAELLDAFADQIASQTALTGFVPTAVVVNPTVLSTLRKARGTSNDAYTFDPLAAGPVLVHGVPLVATASTPADTAWVLGSQAATMFRRGPIQLDVGVTGDDWIRNLTTLRCEERVVLAVQRPAMVSRVTITA